LIAADAEEVRKLFFENLPEGAQVHTGASVTLDTLGITVAEDGRVIVASRSGSQLGLYVSGAGKVIWVVGAQKIVCDVAEGLRHMEEYSLPLEDQRAQKAYGIHSEIAKLLIFNKEVIPGRITLILVKEESGF